jgi:hypothetical protein
MIPKQEYEIRIPITITHTSEKLPVTVTQRMLNDPQFKRKISASISATFPALRMKPGESPECEVGEISIVVNPEDESGFYPPPTSMMR